MHCVLNSNVHTLRVVHVALFNHICMRYWGVESDWARVISVTSGDCALLFSIASVFIQLYKIQRKLFVKYPHLVDEDRYDDGGAALRRA